MVNTGGGVFGEGDGAAGLGGVISPGVQEDGFEDLGVVPRGGAMPGPMGPGPMMPGPMPHPGAGRPLRHVAPPMGGLGAELVAPMAALCPSKWGPGLLGFFAGALTVGLGVGAYCLITRKG